MGAVKMLEEPQQEKSYYKSLLEKNREGAIETFDLILPPLIKPQTGIGVSSNRRLRRRYFVAAFIALMAIFIATAVGVAILLCSKVDLIDYMELKDDYNGYSGDRAKNEDADHSDELSMNYDFRKDLQRIYRGIVGRKRPQDPRIFLESCDKELSQVKNMEDFKFFLIVLISECGDGRVRGRNQKIENHLTVEDFNFTYLLIGKLKSLYSCLDECKRNLTQYEARKHFRDLRGAHDVSAFISMPQIAVDEARAAEISRIVDEYTKPLRTDCTDTSAIFSNNIVLLSEVWERLKRNPELRRPYVYIFASRILYLDADLYLPGTSVAIIAPEWMFVRNVTIFLSGFDAGEHENTNAGANADGDAGYPGGNGGGFLGVGDFRRQNLTVRSDGGKGGDGQNGAHGLNGTEREGNQLRFFEGSRNCSRLLEGIQHKNARGDTVTYYKVYNREACGRSGGNGGRAGEGGSGGEMAFINPEEVTVHFASGKKGVGGRGGKGGKGGFGAGKGCHYVAYSVGQGKLERLTNVKCNADGAPSGFDGKDNFSVGTAKKLKSTGGGDYFSDALQRFRSFARREFLNGDEEIMSFLRKMDELPYLPNVTQFQDFVDETASLETHERLEFYYSLNRRIDVALNSSQVTDDYKNMFAYLKALLYGKITSLKYGFRKCIVVDLKMYLDKIIGSLENVDVETLRQEDHLGPALTEILRDKTAYLSGSFDRWMVKSVNLMRLHSSSLRKETPKDEKRLKAVSRRFDSRKMTYLTLIAAQVLKPLCDGMLNYLNSDVAPEESFVKMRKILHEFEARSQKTNNELNMIMGNYYSTCNSSEIELLSRILIDTGDFMGNLTIFKDVSLHSMVVKDQFQKYQNLMFGELEALSSGKLTLHDVKIHLNKLKTCMKILNNIISLRDSETSFFPVDVEHFENILDLIDILRERRYFIRYWNIVQYIRIENPDLIEKSKKLRALFLDIFITTQYREALNAFRQWVFPHMYIYSPHLPKNPRMTLGEAKKGVNLLRGWLKEYESTIVAYDKHIRETAFSSNSSAGEYYKWSNAEIRSDLEDLFGGKRVALTARVENVHMPTKSAIKFRTVRLEFQLKSGNATNLFNILKDVDVEMKHSGYSYFYYKGEIYLHSSEELDLRYSYASGANGEPINYNMVYKKLMEGPPLFSPYTTWIIQLRPVTSVEPLLQFVKDIDLALVGTGSYISVPSSDS